MTDPVEQARLDRVASAEEVRLQADAEAEREAAERREYNRVKKAESRAREKETRQRERESAPGYHQKLVEENAQAATLRQMRERRERAILIAGELTEPIQKDELIEGTDQSYWLDFFIPELEIFLDETRRFCTGGWDHFYSELSQSEAGRKALEFFGVQPLDLSGVVTAEHRFYLRLVHQPSGGPIPVFVNLSPEERNAVAALKQVWDAGRKAREGWKP